MGDLKEYRIQIHMKRNTCISTLMEPDLFSPLMCLYSSMCDHCLGVLQAFKT